MDNPNNQPSQTTPPTSNSAAKPASLEEKKETARQAMEGAEWTAKREAETHDRAAKEELGQVESKLVGLRQEKEKLELAWIELDDSRRRLRTVIDPLVAEEKKIEAEEATLESEEEKALEGDKQVVEKKRQATQDKRRETEQKKWLEEDKLKKIEATITENTTHYRQLLDEEDKLQTRVDQLKLDPNNN